MNFIRFGGLSKTNQKKVNKKHRTEECVYFHKAPVNKGIYAFIYPYIENFLWVFKLNIDYNLPESEYKKIYKKEYRRLRKKFNYEGEIWCHFLKQVKGGLRSGNWVKTHTRDLEKVLKRVKHDDMKELSKDYYFDTQDIKDPYKRGLGGWMSKDHLEVFIEKVN
jgi:hypothetical protein